MDLTLEKGVVAFMKTSKSEKEWDDNCDKVKAANNNQYPDFWFTAIITSGVLKSLGFDDQIHISSLTL